MSRRVLAAVAATALLVGCSAGNPDPAPTDAPTTERGPTEIEGLERFEDLSNEHVTEPVEYEQVPPVGGQHHPRWLACDVYGDPVPPETAVHSLEHGGVWVTYRPDLDDDAVAALAELTSINREYVLVSPFEDLPAPVVVSAWGLQLQLDDADDPRLQQFVEIYAGGDQGGEPGAACRSGGLTLEQALGALDS